MQSLAEEVQKLLQGNSLYLVGMMGSGKSTVGRLVGKALKYPMLDTDQLIEETSKTTISKIFAQDGEEAFRDLETEVLHVRVSFLFATCPFSAPDAKTRCYISYGCVNQSATNME